MALLIGNVASCPLARYCAWKIMKTIITAASGFLGRHLLKHLVAQGNQKVYSLSREPLEMPEVDEYCVDLTNEEEVERILLEIQPDRIYHLVGISKISQNFQMPDYFASNTLTTLSLLRAVRKLGKPVGFFFSSSMHVYGNQEEEVNETSLPKPGGPYAFTKYLSEQALRSFCVENPQIKCVVGRLYSCFGPGQGEGFVAADLCRKVLSLPEKGDGTLQVGPLNTFRRFLDARDIVRAFPVLLDQKTGSNYEIYNLASPHELEISEMLQMILKITNRNPKVESSTNTPNSFKGLKVNTEKLFKTIPPSHFRPVEETLRDMVEEARRRAIPA